MTLKGTCNRWPRHFKEVDGISIDADTIRRRLEIEEVLGSTGIDVRGRYHKNEYFYEVDVRRVCADLLAGVFVANENGFFEIDGVFCATCLTWSEHLKKEGILIDSSTLLRRLKKMKRVGLDGRTYGKQFLSGAFYSEADIRETVKCSPKTATHVQDITPVSLSGGVIQKQYLPALARLGIINRQSLLSRTTTWYNSEAQFDPVGKSFTFFSHILGRRVRRVTAAVLEEVADKFGWTEENVMFSEEERQQYIDLLTPHGITDYESLFDFGAPWFKSKSVQFPQIGNGFAFLSRVLGKPVRLISNEVLEEVAQLLKWKKVDNVTELMPVGNEEFISLPSLEISNGNQPLQAPENHNQQYLKALDLHEIIDYQSLFDRSIRWYNSKQAQFPPFGGAIKFFGLVLGRTIRRVTIDVLHEVADKLGWN